MIEFIGTTFPDTFQWHTDEISLINNIKNQIDIHYPNSNNLLINTTWFGPQFDNGEYNKFLQLVKDNKTFDNLFLIAAADPVFLNKDQINQLQGQVQATQLFLIGHFDTAYYFNFHSTVIPKYFKSYTIDELVLTEPSWIFLNYNRKPREHRSEFVNKLTSAGLGKVGVITLGNNITLGETIDDYIEGNWGMADEYGIPHDIHSLGKLDLWQHHFLTVVGETEFWPWDNMFISEKTWKPIVGLRPFVINGQTTIYKYLRDNGFKTFNHYFNGIELENIPEYCVHTSIIQVIEYLKSLNQQEIMTMYQTMLPDLIHNRERFFKFSQEQTYKIDHIFE
jgi:hypothetical protein